MDLEEALMQEHSKSQRNKIVRYVGTDKERFRQLMNLFFRGEYRISQRAAWPMSYIAQQNPDLMKPYLGKMIAMLGRTDIHNAVTRNIVRTLQNIDVPPKLRGRLMTACFNLVESPDTPVAIKAFSLTVLRNLANVYPEIMPELKNIIEDRLEHESAAFRSRATKIFKHQIEKDVAGNR